MDPTAPTLPFCTAQTDFQGKFSIWDFREKNKEGEFLLLVFFFFISYLQIKTTKNLTLSVN